MKRYVLGDYELTLIDAIELNVLIETRLNELQDYQEYCDNSKLIKIYDEKVKRLSLMLEQLERYGK